MSIRLTSYVGSFIFHCIYASDMALTTRIVFNIKQQATNYQQQQLQVETNPLKPPINPVLHQ